MIFVDSNIIIYYHDAKAKEKHSLAKRLLNDLWPKGELVISVQVLQEVLVNLVRKGTSQVKAREIIEDYMQWEVIDNTLPLFKSAMEIQGKNKLSFWDAMIIAAASKAGAKQILSEDLNHGQKIEGIKIVNPFKV